jgi:ubiquinol-cytochrome c reductase iron-sulfur subunit
VRRRLARVGGGLLAAALFIRGAGKPRPEDVEPDPTHRDVGSKRRAEGVAIALMLCACLCGLAFPFLYVLADSNSTQWLGLSIGLALMFTAAGSVVAGKAVVPRETIVEERPQLSHGGDEQQNVVEGVASVGEGVTRRGLLTAATGAAGFAIATAAAVPAMSLGPKVGQIIADTPWKRGRYLVDERDARIKADEIALGQMVTAFPEGADKEDLGSAIVVVRLQKESFDMTPEQMAGVVEGLVAYSKVCTHAACAVSMFRYPLSQPTTDKKPALVCPCHYSTFNPGKGAKVEFGPAGRSLPQLPLELDPAGLLVAAGEMSGPPGPAWWSVRES